MIRSRSTMVLLLSTLLTIVAQPTLGRPVRIWTQQELFDEADLVVIVTSSDPKKTENTDDFLPNYLQRLESELAVHSVLKGNIASTKTSVTFVHFRYRDDIETTLGNGPSFAVMGTKPTKSPRVPDQKPMYLLYLRARPDGKYEPVSGNMDPVDSVVRLLLFPEWDPALDDNK